VVFAGTQGTKDACRQHTVYIDLIAYVNVRSIHISQSKYKKLKRYRAHKDNQKVGCHWSNDEVEQCPANDAIGYSCTKRACPVIMD
jgi:hypothetical protein